MPSPSVVAVCMPEWGHLVPMLPMIDALARRGVTVHVLADPRFAEAVTQVGGQVLDLFAEGPLEEVDDESTPVPSRYVTFAAHRARAIAARVAPLAPRLVLYETFAVVGRVVARELGVPMVHVNPGYPLVANRAIAALQRDPRVRTAPACHEAVALLQQQFGMANASPFSYVDGISPDLNVYTEPPQFLADVDRPAAAPLACFGSLLPGRHGDATSTPARCPGDPPRILISFGTVVWRHLAAEAEALAAQVAEEAVAAGARVTVGTGGHALSPGVLSALERSGAAVHRWLDQWTALHATDVFVTHHGLSSTHEAIWHGVPMLSCPFFSDQPARAARCQALGLALPLWTPGEGPLARGHFARQLAALEADHAGFTARLAAARRWEEETIAGRDAVVEQILALGT